MSSLVIFLLVALSTILSINIVESKQRGDIEKEILEYLTQSKGIKRHDRSSSTSSDDSLALSDDDSDSDDGMYLMREGKVRSDDIIGLIEKITRVINKKQEKKDDEALQGRITKTRILEELLSRNLGKTGGMNELVKPKKNMVPNTLLPFKLKDDDDSNVSGLENYSKIFIILNPTAAPRNEKKPLNNMVSDMLPQNSAASKRTRPLKSMPKRYKGFLVRDDLRSRRARRESKESEYRMYAPKDTIEDEYKGKRSRNDRGGGGGGGGRTAIPYIRHRGDIYERDN